jgi:hypothetical protein
MKRYYLYLTMNSSFQIFTIYHFSVIPKPDLIDSKKSLNTGPRPVFFNCQATAWYQTLASVIPGPRLIEKRITGPQSDKG